MRSARPSGVRGAARVRTWYDDEPPPAPAARALARRLVRRGRVSWRIWGGAALLLALAVAAYRARLPPFYRVSVVIRVTEGESLSSAGNELGAGALGSYVNDVVFANHRLIALMKRHPNAFRGVEKNPMSELEDFRKQLEVTISQNDFVQERDPSDPPRSARIVIAFTAGEPRLALAVAQELADLVVGSAGERQREALARERAAAAEALERAMAQLRETTGAPSIDPSDPRLRALRARLKAADHQVAAAEIALRAAEQRQGIRFELVDSGRLPTASITPNPLTGFLSTLILVVAGGCLLAGAFDTRVLDAGDIEALGLVSLGRLPRPAEGSRSTGNEGDPGELPGPPS